jgi:hypothetical protein
MEFKLDKGKFNWASSPVGPAGDLSAVDDKVVWQTVAREGKAMADEALAVLNPQAFQPLTRLAYAQKKEMLPLREDIPNYQSDRKEEKEKVWAAYQDALKNNASPRVIRDLCEQYNRLMWCGNSSGQNKEDLVNRTTPYELTAIRLNDVVLAGVPGETVMHTNDYLRANTYGDRLVVMTECNAGIGYVATREQFPFGSYEVGGGLNDITGEQKLREAARDLIRKV